MYYNSYVNSDFKISKLKTYLLKKMCFIFLPFPINFIPMFEFRV